MFDSERLKRLLMEVPRAPESAIPDGVTNEDLDRFTETSGIPLPMSVREWLKTSNGPCVGPGGIYGIRPTQSGLDIDRYLDIFPLWKEKKWIPIAGDGCGNYYVIPTQFEFGAGFPVMFLDTSSSLDTPAYIVASDLEHFLVFLLESELGKQGWPFDKKMVVGFDPQIVNVKGAPLPWEGAKGI